jgi:hypothetical protein
MDQLHLLKSENSFLLSLVSFGWAVFQKKIRIWKSKWARASDTKSSLVLWTVRLKHIDDSEVTTQEKTRYDYNLTIMKSPKPATDNRLKWTLCIVTNSELEIEQCWICEVLLQPFWKWRPVEFFQCQESIRDIIIYLHMKCRWNRTCWFCAVLWWPFWKWRLLEIFECRE